MSRIIDHSSDEVLAIIGLCKNAGKTSLMNWLISESTGVKLGVMTTGRDGEEIDVAFGNPKPRVKLPEHTIFCCETAQLDALGSGITILQKLPWESASKAIWIVEANHPLETEIIGPATVKVQSQCAALMQSWGARKILIDGSIDRKSIALDPLVDALYIVAGGSFGTGKQILAELQRLIHLSTIPQYCTESDSPTAARMKDSKTIWHKIDGSWQDLRISSLLHTDQNVWNSILTVTNSEALYLPGALTEAVFKRLYPWMLQNGVSLICRHPHNIKLSDSNVECLLQGISVFALNVFKIRAIALNPWSVTGNHLDVASLRAALRQGIQQIPVIDIMELYE
ncbi:MAG: hypothetical protein CVU48_05095 [Candidatus Cloacimonetes bacterium HGW-Cloacimonetes-1]|nr:MAG: hypothetical protein CVU48_05095 [Candidatus Cloacimonetes bacterium HGW-Cloacimonetes-1]